MDTLEEQKLNGSKDSQSLNGEAATPSAESDELVKTKELLRVEREQKVGVAMGVAMGRSLVEVHWLYLQ